MTSQKTNSGFRVLAGTRVGLSHKGKNTNNMDAVAYQIGRGVVVGGVADGSGGSGAHSECFSNPRIEWLTLRLRGLLEENHDVRAVAQTLWEDYLTVLQRDIDNQFFNIPGRIIQEPASKHHDHKTVFANRQLKFADEYMLHTVVMFATIYDEGSDSWDGFLIYKGDGFVLVNGRMTNLDTVIKPTFNGVMYPALALRIYDGTISQKNQDIARDGFHIVYLGKSGVDWNRIGVSSDGARYMTEDMLDEIAYPYIDPSLDVDMQERAIEQAMHWAIRDGRLTPDDDLGFVSFMTAAYLQELEAQLQAETDDMNRILAVPLANYPKVQSTPIMTATSNDLVDPASVEQKPDTNPVSPTGNTAVTDLTSDSTSDVTSSSAETI